MLFKRLRQKIVTITLSPQGHAESISLLFDQLKKTTPEQTNSQPESAPQGEQTNSKSEIIIQTKQSKSDQIASAWKFWNLALLLLKDKRVLAAIGVVALAVICAIILLLKSKKDTKRDSNSSTLNLQLTNVIYKKGKDSHILLIPAKPFTEFISGIKSTLKIQEDVDVVLKSGQDGNIYVLDSIQSDSSLECWWETKPNEPTKWEEKGENPKYYQRLLRNQQHLVGDRNVYLKKLIELMTFFGADISQVNKAYVLFNQKLFDSFQNHRTVIFGRQKETPEHFKKDDWKNGKNLRQKLKFYDHYIKMAEGFYWNHSKFLHAIPMIHGTNETALDKICQDGLGATGKTDGGYYGQGIYFSSSLDYSSKYAEESPNGKPFIICMITPGNIYPVTESPYLEGPDKIENPKGFLGKSNKFGYQSHYTLVDKSKYKDAYPIKGNIDENTVNELVVFQDAQVLPLFAIYCKGNIDDKTIDIASLHDLFGLDLKNTF